MSRNSEKPKQKSRKTLAVLISCCIFLTITCASLLTALVLIGKHLVSNAPSSRNIKTSNYNRTNESSLFRLPRDVLPLSYDLTIKPVLETGEFKGLVDIKVNVTRNRKNLIVNSKNLIIDTVELTHFKQHSKVFRVENIQEIVEQEVLLITTKELITAGLYNLRFKYSGSMLNKTSGLYRSRHTDTDNGTERYIATSKFEPTYARQAFPCFDEPNLKATYKVHLLKPKDINYVALSNYPETSQEELTDEGVLVHFNETVPMSTYLVCFIVSDFKFTETHFDNIGSSIPFRVYATPGQLDKTEYGGAVGKKVIEYYIKYFNIPYPLPKLDMVAIPDFVSGAMEHWGLVTFRETALLYNSNTHSASNKQRVAEVVAHELAHSWFGNLVTMDWWNNLWLNEGFASYIEYKGVDVAEPTWQMMDQFLIGTLHSVLSLDATQGSHPIIQTVITPDQITEVFDSISYNKGASVLRMLESVVGPENFQKGVTNYLNKFVYGNAVTQNLWDELQIVVGDKLNVTEFMDTFTIQMGYPILDIKINDNKYQITQKRFLKDYETTGKESPLNYKWSVPVTFITDVDKSGTIHWFNYKTEELTIDKPTGVQWIKFNPDQVGYYRVNYPETEWKNLISHILELSIPDKTHLLEESFSIAESGELSYTIPLDLSKYLAKEENFIPWTVASSQFLQLLKYLQNSKYEAKFKNYVIKLLKPAYNSLDWNDTDASEEQVKKLARVQILNLACAMDYDVALSEAKNRFDEWITNDNVSISPNLRSIIYKFGMVNANESTWNALFDLFASENDANEKLKLMNGLANVRNPSLLRRLIELAKDETYVRSQDYFTLLNYISANPIGTSIVWDYVRENWLHLVERFTLNDRYLGRLIPSITTKFSTSVKFDEMQHFFAKYPEAGAGASARRQALETVNNNIKWLTKYKEVVEKWLEDLQM